MHLNIKRSLRGARWEAAASVLRSVALQGDAVTRMATMAALCDGLQWDTALENFRGGDSSNLIHTIIKCISFYHICDMK